MTNNKVVLITGAAQRIGRQLVLTLHANNYNVLIHYHRSRDNAEELANELNAIRENSARTLTANLANVADVLALAQRSEHHWGRIDALINNASGYYATPWGKATENDWDTLIGSNLKSAFFLAQALLPAIGKQHGSIINIVDIFAEKPLPDHPLYCIAKAGLAMLTKSMALDCGDGVRVNGIAPGAILWPETPLGDDEKQQMLEKIPSRTIGNPVDIANTALFLLEQATYINGQIIAVDGGLSLS